MDETGVPRENYRLVTDKLGHTMLFSSTACYDNVQLAVSYTVEVEVLKNN
jgi:hypothetical protein